MQGTVSENLKRGARTEKQVQNQQGRKQQEWLKEDERRGANETQTFQTLQKAKKRASDKKR